MIKQYITKMRAFKEIKIKFRLENKKDIQKKLLSMDWVISSLYFQKEYRIKDLKDELSRNGIFPRARSESGKSTFTIKVNPNGEMPKNNCKYFERLEYNLEIEDAQKMAEMFSLLGYKYRILEKYRQDWINPDKKSSLSIFIDSLPFGNYMELEGSPKEIELMVKNLSLEKNTRITVAYWKEYKRYCEENNLIEEDQLSFKRDLI